MRGAPPRILRGELPRSRTKIHVPMSSITGNEPLLPHCRKLGRDRAGRAVVPSIEPARASPPPGE